MSRSMIDLCDHYIERCRQVLKNRDTQAARLLRAEATARFHAVVPRWEAGLMASITHYYLDDIESILGKLLTYRAQLERDGDRPCQTADTRSIRLHRHRLNRIDSFEEACRWIRDSYAASSIEKAEILAKIASMQEIARSNAPRSEKWASLRTFVEWVNSQNDELASHVLPLINDALS